MGNCDTYEIMSGHQQINTTTSLKQVPSDANLLKVWCDLQSQAGDPLVQHHSRQTDYQLAIDRVGSTENFVKGLERERKKVAKEQEALAKEQEALRKQQHLNEMAALRNEESTTSEEDEGVHERLPPPPYRQGLEGVTRKGTRPLFKRRGRRDSFSGTIQWEMCWAEGCCGER